MSTQAGLEIFERAVEGRGRILRVEADHAGETPGLLALTFDVGRIVVRPGDEGLVVEQVQDRSAMPDGLEALDREEPWWRLIGQPITAAWPSGVEAAVGARGLGSLMVLTLRFREDKDNPRVMLTP